MFRFSFAILALIPLARLPNPPCVSLGQAGGRLAYRYLRRARNRQSGQYLYRRKHPVRYIPRPERGPKSSGFERPVSHRRSRLGVRSPGPDLRVVHPVDPQNPATLYAASSGSLVRSTNAGATFSTIPTPSAYINALAVNPVNDRILYIATFDQGVLKSTDAGTTWTAINTGLSVVDGQIMAAGLWIDPSQPTVLLASASGSLVRSTDSGASWQTVYPAPAVASVYFDTGHPGLLYVTMGVNSPNLKSTDHGQTFTTFTTPSIFASIVSDPNHLGHLIGTSAGGIFQSTDDGATWTPSLNLLPPLYGQPLTPDWANGVLYTVAVPSSIVRVSTGLKTVTPVGPPALGYITGIAVSNGHAYVANVGSHDVYVTKLDLSGNVVYSTYFGGSADDLAAAMAVDSAGNVYVTGTTTSLDFPVTPGAFASTGASFLFRLNPDGSTGYSTYFAPAGSNPDLIAVDSTGSAYVAGWSAGGLPVTPGAYQMSCMCPEDQTIFMTFINYSGFLAKFNPAASGLAYSTYIGGTTTFGNPLNVIALAPDGSAYVAGQNGINRLNSTGSALLATSQPFLNARAMTVAPDGSLYVAGAPNTGANPFQATPGAFETTPIGPPQLPGQSVPSPAAVARLDAQLDQVLAATYFGGPYETIQSLLLDSTGHLYLGGATGPQGLPTRTPLQGGFAATTGFLGELSGDLSTLLFSSYFGDTGSFTVESVAFGIDGSLLLGGATVPANSIAPVNLYVNSLDLAPPPALRIDSVESAASLLDTPISAGETIVVRGAGFGSTSQLFIGDAPVAAISLTPTILTAVVPQSVAPGAVQVQVQSGGASSNSVLMPVATASPAIFSTGGSGYGQGYILNQDGTLNTPSNPASPGDKITIFATGVGPVSFTNGYAVTQFPPSVFIDGFYADGVAAVMGPVNGLPGSVYQITVYVPNPASLVASNPNLANFTFPPQVGVILQIDGIQSQNGIELSISQ